MRRLIVLLICLLPLPALIILGEEGFGVSPFLVMLILLALFLAAGAFISGSCEEEEAQDEPAKNQASDERIRSLANDLEPFLSIKGGIPSVELFNLRACCELIRPTPSEE